MEQVGLKPRVITSDVAGMIDDIFSDTGTGAMYHMSWASSGDPHHAAAVYSSSFAWYFGDEPLQALIDQGLTTLDPAQREQTYSDLQAHLWEQAWHVPLYNSDFTSPTPPTSAGCWCSPTCSAPTSTRPSWWASTSTMGQPTPAERLEPTVAARFVVRAGQMLLVILAVVTITFFVLRIATGDPARLVNPPGTPEDVITQTRERLGTDRPLLAQYGSYLLDLARATSAPRSVAPNRCARRWSRRSPTPWPWRVWRWSRRRCSPSAWVWRPHAGRAAGSTAASWDSSPWPRRHRRSGSAWCSCSSSRFRLGWFPAIDMTGPRSFVLPGITLAITLCPVLIRTVRQSFLESQGEDFIRAARARGVPERRVFLVHCLKIAALPLITLIGLQFGFLLAGAVVVESIFNWPGIGRLTLNAVASRDFPMIQGGVLVAAVAFVILNFLVDLLYSVLDPRVRLGTR